MAKSKICEIDGTNTAAAAAIQEANEFGIYCGLAGRDALHLRLLAEELLGVVTGVTDITGGTFEIENAGKEYKLVLSADTMPIGENAKSRLMDTSSTGDNVLYKGFSGKLRQIADCYCVGIEGMDVSSQIIDVGSVAGSTGSYWSLYRVKEQIKRDERAAEWDELERSVLSRLADDVQVGIRYEKVVITVIKKF